MPYSILIVEDDLTFATMLKTWLGKKGFLVDTAGNSARARKQLDAQPYNLVLSDLRLPDQDGISLLAWMKEHGHQIPLIIMTGYADIQSAVQAMKNGANDYISKPVQPDVLLKKINEALQNETVIAAPSGSAPPAAAHHTVAGPHMVLPGFLRTAAASHTGLCQHTAAPAAHIPAGPDPDPGTDPQAGTGYHTGLRTLLQQPLISPHIYHDSLQDPPGNH